MDFTSKNYFIINLVILSLILVTFISVGQYWTPRSTTILNIFQQQQQQLQNKTNVDVDDLGEVLSRASTEDKTVIITIVNKAYVEPHNDMYPTMLDLFLEGFWVGESTERLLRHLVVVSMDQTAFRRCKFRGLNCYMLVIEGVDYGEEKLYMSDDFIKMMWARTFFLLGVLKRGYNYIFTDTDVLWLRDPFPILKMFNDTDDLQISTDKFNGYATSIRNRINTGFYYVKSNNRIISLFETWYDRRQNSTGMKEQDVLESLIVGGIIEKFHLKVRFLDTLYFSGFCKDSRDATLVATVHANCCRSIGAKVSDLTAVLKDWKRLKLQEGENNASGNSNRTVLQWSHHVACWKSWKTTPSTLTN